MVQTLSCSSIHLLFSSIQLLFSSIQLLFPPSNYFFLHPTTFFLHPTTFFLHPTTFEGLDKNVQNVGGRFGRPKSFSKAFSEGSRIEFDLTLVRPTLEIFNSRNYSHRNTFWTFLKTQKCPNSDFFHRTLLEKIFGPSDRIYLTW